MDKASGGDGIPVDLFQILKDDAVKVLHSICQQIWKEPFQSLKYNFSLSVGELGIGRLRGRKGPLSCLVTWETCEGQEAGGREGTKDSSLDVSWNLLQTF